MIMGYSLCGYVGSLNQSGTIRDTITSTKISNAIFDDLYVTLNTSIDFVTPVPDDWDYDTIFKAPYNNSLEASNVDFSVNNTSALLIKRRRKGTFKWTLIDAIKTIEPEDFDFLIRDYYCAAKRDYEFALVPFTNGTEGRYITVMVYSDFDGIHVVDKENIFSAYADITFNTTKNRPNSSNATFGHRYSFVVSNGSPDYYTGDVSALFAKIQDCQLDFENNRDYKNALLDNLNNGCAKILKHTDSRIFMICVTGEPSEPGTENTDSNENLISFTWSEIGDAEDSNDFYYNGLTDIGIEGLVNDIISDGAADGKIPSDVWIDISETDGSMYESTFAWKRI